MQNRRIWPVLALPLIVAAAACDNEETVDVVALRAPLAQVNAPTSGGPASGTADIAIIGNQALTVRISAAGLDTVVHPQFLMSGGACATSANDTNGDGIVDINEGASAWGTILGPIDNVLGVQTIDLAAFPSGASYTFVQTTDLGRFTNSLVTLAGAALDFTTRTVLVTGVTGPVPSTVAAIPGLTAAQSVPVLCGRIAAR
ncbi:MAG TPA: hypothetical protein VFQ38_03835 [Longimicrobiales bacterium]|nr:hypothetical protein [Longimicrobiales bacterium]